MGPFGIDKENLMLITHIVTAFVGTKESRKLLHISLQVQEIKRHKEHAGEEMLQQ